LAGYPAAFTHESEITKINRDLHDDDDTLEKINYQHMKEHAMMVVGFVYELAFANI
jgi:leucyl aminopeptidase